MLDKEKNADITTMQPVWCFFGGDGAAVLALQPSSAPIELEGRPYCAILVPTAPIPVGAACSTYRWTGCARPTWGSMR